MECHAFGKVFMNYNTPRNTNNGRAYESSLLGSILSLSCIPKNETGPYEFFTSPSSQSKREHDITESNLWLVSSDIHSLKGITACNDLIKLSARYYISYLGE